MQFFDLNIAYLEDGDNCNYKSAKKQNRLRLIIKAMEMGYTGIAYNKTINVAMSQSDRCSIPPFPLSSLINVSPCLSSTVSFHRRLLGVPRNIPFRQYTRLTVVVDNNAQASALNSANPILKTYDFVAVRPLNQNCFDQACHSSQVDLISIDFAHKLPFRLKLPMVKAAIARGVFFEITYSGLMEDVQARRQLISNAKLLVEWTRGKNLIVSSAASSVVELRGPNDVSNLLSLFGLSNEHAKAAISKNCRLLLANALRKKQFYKEAIRVEGMPVGSQTDPKEPWIVDDLDWDPISSGDGDLCLDDMAKSFANSGKVSQTVKAIDFASIVESAQSHGLLVNDTGFTVEGKPCQSGNGMDFISQDLESSEDTIKLQKETTQLLYSQLDQQGHCGEKSQQAMLADSPKAPPVHEDLRSSSTIFLQELGNPNLLEEYIPGHEAELQKRIASHPPGDGLDVGNSDDSKEKVRFNTKDVSDSRVDANCSQLVSDACQLGDQSDIPLNGHVFPLTESPKLDARFTIHANEIINADSFVERHGSDVSLQVEETKEPQIKGEFDNNEDLLDDTMMQVDYSPRRKDNGGIIIAAKSKHLEDVTMEVGKQEGASSGADYHSVVENKSGNEKVRRLVSNQVGTFPFKRLLQVQLKKKGRKSRPKR